jgi:hypothetical protein
MTRVLGARAASNDEPVQVIVASTLKDLVWEADHDVFIEFYAPCTPRRRRPAAVG